MSARDVPEIDPFGRGFCFNFYMGELMRRWFAMDCSGGVCVLLPMGDDSRLIGVATDWRGGLGQLVRGLADPDCLVGCRLDSCVDGLLAAYYVSIEWRGLWRLVGELGDRLLGGWRTPLDREVSITGVQSASMAVEWRCRCDGVDARLRCSSAHYSRWVSSRLSVARRRTENWAALGESLVSRFVGMFCGIGRKKL